MMQKDERRPKGQVLKPGFTSKLFKELLEGLREQKCLVNYLNKDLGIGWRNLSLKQLRDVPLSILADSAQLFVHVGSREVHCCRCHVGGSYLRLCRPLLG